MDSSSGKDERVKVDPFTSPPYKWICHLEYRTQTGCYNATGFKIHVPNINRMIIVTSGHVVWNKIEYSTNMTVTIPGVQDPIPVQAGMLYAPSQWCSEQNNDYDYGFISLPGNSDDGFGWSAIVPDSELSKRIVTVCGYPGDKPAGTMWVTGREITSVSPFKILYMNDTTPEQSGSPVYTWYKGYWTVVGVHSIEGSSARRFTSAMIYSINSLCAWQKYALHSSFFPDVYVRCNGKSLDCSYKPAGNDESFYIYPVEVTPSLAPAQTNIVILRSSKWNVRVRMDGSAMTEPLPPGGGTVNCKPVDDPYSPDESFFLVKCGDSFGFRSTRYDHCLLRVQGKGVTSPGNGGEVNCQYYHSTDIPPYGFEVINLQKMD